MIKLRKPWFDEADPLQRDLDKIHFLKLYSADEQDTLWPLQQALVTAPPQPGFTLSKVQQVSRHQGSCCMQLC